jgi:hypothetical protein
MRPINHVRRVQLPGAINDESLCGSYCCQRHCFFYEFLFHDCKLLFCLLSVIVVNRSALLPLGNDAETD